MRHLTESELNRIQAQKKNAGLSTAALNQRCGFRSNRLTEACRGRVKLSDQEVAVVFSVLASAQPVTPDNGQRMLCTVCKKWLCPPGHQRCKNCPAQLKQNNEAEVYLGVASVEVDGKPLLTQEEKQLTEKLAALVTPVYDTIAKLRTEVFERFAQAENASVANANFAESIHERLIKLENFVILGSEATEDSLNLHKSFANFERICRGMRAKCPQLFAATVRRACEVA